MQKILKSAGSVDDVTVNWAASGLLTDGVVISGSTSVGSTGLTVAEPSPDHTDTTGRARISGGTLGEVYELTNRVTLSNGQVHEKTVLVEVVEFLLARSKDPDESKDLRVKLGASGMLAAGEEIASISVSAEAGITVAASSFTANTATVRVSGGTLGETYRVTVAITTDEGQVKEFIWAVTVASSE